MTYIVLKSTVLLQVNSTMSSSNTSPSIDLYQPPRSRSVVPRSCRLLLLVRQAASTTSHHLGMAFCTCTHQYYACNWTISTECMLLAYGSWEHVSVDFSRWLWCCFATTKASRTNLKPGNSGTVGSTVANSESLTSVNTRNVTSQIDFSLNKIRLRTWIVACGWRLTARILCLFYNLEYVPFHMLSCGLIQKRTE